jgi:hypothetical protein
MHIKQITKPLDIPVIAPIFQGENSWIDSIINLHTSGEELISNKIVLLAISKVEEDIISIQKIRSSIYSLSDTKLGANVVDAGVYNSIDLETDIEILGNAFAELIEKRCIPVIYYASHIYTLSQYQVYKLQNRLSNAIFTDAFINFKYEVDPLTDFNFLNRIISEINTHLFNLTHLGHQSHFIDDYLPHFLENLNFDVYKVSEVRQNFNDIEPYFRRANFVSFDLLSIRNSDYPKNLLNIPSGFSIEEACKIMRYAGSGQKINSLGLYCDNKKLIDSTSAYTIALLIWYFVEGRTFSIADTPNYNRDSFLRYIVVLESLNTEIVFYRHKKHNIWWFEVPVSEDISPTQNVIIPCSISDYEIATKNEIPNNWFKAIKRYS